MCGSIPPAVLRSRSLSGLPEAPGRDSWRPASLMPISSADACGIRDCGSEAFQVGKRSATDVFVGYIKDIVDPELLSEVRRRLNRINVSALPLGSKSLEEYLFGTKRNPFPVVRYTERPDVVAAHLLEGHIVIITDTTPTAMIVPVTAWHFTQHARGLLQ